MISVMFGWMIGGEEWKLLDLGPQATAENLGREFTVNSRESEKKKDRGD